MPDQTKDEQNGNIKNAFWNKKNKYKSKILSI